MKLQGMKFAAMIGAGLVTMAAWGTAAAVDPQPVPVPADAVPAVTAPVDSAAAVAAPVDSASRAKEPAGAAHQYVGVKKCKVCHNSKKEGAQYTHWLGTKHAKAYETLASDLSKGVAKRKGISDPQTSGECLQCHVTGHGEPEARFEDSFVGTDGVQCESCHGAGKDYVAKKVMQGIADGTLKGEDYGLVRPTKDRCVQCHNEKSPTFVEMNFASDSTKIAHPNPRRPKRGAAGSDKPVTN